MKALVKHTIRLFILLLIPISCTQEIINIPDFDVNVDDKEFYVGDTVVFHLTGNPDLIAFYSGEVGNNYDFALKDRIVESVASLSFQTQNRSQKYSGSDFGSSFCQEDQFKVHLSTSFNGQYDRASIASAQWTDITHLFNIPSASCSSTAPYVAAGKIEINDLVEDEKPFFIAFQYINRPNKEYGNSNIWRITDFQLISQTDSEDIVVANQNSITWHPVFIGENWDPAKAFEVSTTRITLRGNTEHRDLEQELWCITDTLMVDKLINIGQDKSVAIKSMAEISLASYSYVFSSPGVYNVTFIAINVSIYDRKEVVRNVTITINNK